ncbi:unnamed protein product [Moneuplotes crassus]|uniref:Uncharacterized protein n=1 Tax=Euplotes crassus TaxID=5936 RepID=A0AAD1XKN8_EUPCR|nr:unnamed protein product [Moneuplotes crassus]
MNRDKGLIALGIGASLVAAFATYKMTKKEKKRAKRKVRKLFKTRDVDGNSDSVLCDIELTIIESDKDTNSSQTEEKYTEVSIPLNKKKKKKQGLQKIIQGEDIDETVTSSEITKTIATNHWKRPNAKNNDEHNERASSVDSEEERFNKWQKERQSKLHAVNYIKNDKIYTEINPDDCQKKRSQEKKKLKNFLTTYKKDRFKPVHKRRKNSIRSHLTDCNRSSTSKVSLSGKTSTRAQRTKDSGANSLNEELSEKKDTNFFDIFMAISKPIVDDKQERKRMRRRVRRQARAHSNAVSEPNFLR